MQAVADGDNPANPPPPKPPSSPPCPLPPCLRRAAAHARGRLREGRPEPRELPAHAAALPGPLGPA